MVSITELPDVVIDKIMSFFTYDEIANNRIVSRWFNKIGWRMLNTGYFAVEQSHRRKLKEIKAKLPRRESERRNHPLARKCDILKSVDTRLSMLSMTYRRYIDSRLCCFIPGKVLDELFKLLKYLDSSDDISRTNDVLRELRDISTMAIEYFDEKLAPQLKTSFVILQAENIIRNSGLTRVLPKVPLSSCDSLTGIPLHISDQRPMVAIDNQDGDSGNGNIAVVVDDSLTGDNIVNSLIVEMFTNYTRYEIKKKEDACKKNMNVLKSILHLLIRRLKQRTEDVNMLTDNLNLQANILMSHEITIKNLKKCLEECCRRCITTEKLLEDFKKDYVIQKTEPCASKRVHEEITGFSDESPLKKLKPQGDI